MRRQAQGDRLHRGSRRHRHHPCAHATTRGGRTVTTARATPSLGAPRHPKPGQAVLEHRLTLVCGLDVGDAPIRASFRDVPSLASSRYTVCSPTRRPPQAIPIGRTPQNTPFGRLFFLCSSPKSTAAFKSTPPKFAERFPLFI